MSIEIKNIDDLDDRHYSRSIKRSTTFNMVYDDAETNLLKLLSDHNMSFSDLSRYTGVASSSISEYAYGIRSLVHLRGEHRHQIKEEVIKICDFFYMDVTDVFPRYFCSIQNKISSDSIEIEPEGYSKRISNRKLENDIFFNELLDILEEFSENNIGRKGVSIDLFLKHYLEEYTQQELADIINKTSARVNGILRQTTRELWFRKLRLVFDEIFDNKSESEKCIDNLVKLKLVRIEDISILKHILKKEDENKYPLERKVFIDFVFYNRELDDILNSYWYRDITPKEVLVYFDLLCHRIGEYTSRNLDKYRLNGKLENFYSKHKSNKEMYKWKYIILYMIKKMTGEQYDISNLFEYDSEWNHLGIETSSSVGIFIEKTTYNKQLFSQLIEEGCSIHKVFIRDNNKIIYTANCSEYHDLLLPEDFVDPTNLDYKYFVHRPSRKYTDNNFANILNEVVCKANI